VSRFLAVSALRVAVVLSLFDPLMAADWRIQRAVQEARTPPLEGVMRTATDAGRREIVLGLLLGVALLSGPAGPATAREALFALVPANLVVDGIKWSVRRTRPDGDRKPGNSSFPSGHAAGAFALAMTLSRRWRKLAPVFFLAAGLVAFSRIYLNRHFASDVLVGAMIGLAIAWYVGMRFRKETLEAHVAGGG